MNNIINYIPIVCIIMGIFYYNFQYTKKYKEPLVPISPVISSIISSPSPDISTSVQYSTNSRIDYNYIDNTIDELTQQYDGIKTITDNLIFKQTTTTGSNPNIDPIVTISGSFPSNISLQFIFPPPKIGETGKQGVTGNQGKSGAQGKQGIIGEKGYYERTSTI